MFITLEVREDAIPTTSLFASSSPSPLSPSSVSSSQSWPSQATSEPDSLASPSQDPSSTSSSSSNTNAIIGSVVGGLAVLGIIVIAALYLLLRHRLRKTETPTNEGKGTEESPPHTSTIKQGGWGPSELPAYSSPKPPVELPAETANHHNLHYTKFWERDAHSKSWFIND